MVGFKETHHFFGANSRNRTGDLLITNQLLYRLSHIGNTFILQYHFQNCKQIFNSILFQAVTNSGCEKNLLYRSFCDTMTILILRLERGFHNEKTKRKTVAGWQKVFLCSLVGVYCTSLCTIIPSDYHLYQRIAYCKGGSLHCPRCHVPSGCLYTRR